jgi:hypothetical protein
MGLKYEPPFRRDDKVFLPDFSSQKKTAPNSRAFTRKPGPDSCPECLEFGELAVNLKNAGNL